MAVTVRYAPAIGDRRARPPLLLHPCLALLAVVVIPAIGRAGSSAAGLHVTPKAAKLAGNFDKVQLLVCEGGSEDPTARDLTHEARYESLAPEVVSVDSSGVVRAVGNGEGRVRILHEEGPAEVPIRVEGVAPSYPIDFRRDIVPVLSKAGCNMGACHGAQYGQAGFKLSLFGFEPENDYLAIARDRRSRRVVFPEPDRSLILRKATLAIPHGGGKRLDPKSDEYRVLREWLSQGCPGPSDDAVQVTDLVVSPASRIMDGAERQQLRVEARYADGTSRDVTALTKFDVLNDGVAQVDPTGLVAARGKGQTAVMVRYQGQAEVSTVIMPFSRSPKEYDFRPANFIDELVLEKWRQLGLVPSAPASDAVFLRRAYLDAIGTLPTAEAVRTFLDSDAPDKRAQLVDELLGLTGDPKRDRFTNEFSAYWALKWGDLLRNNRNALGEQGMWAFYNWLRQAVRQNKPLDQFARELITAQGSIYSSGPANYFRVARNAPDQAETTAQVFLGIRLQCAKCHHHPFEKYSQADYYGMAAFFSRVGTKGSTEFGLFGREQIVRVLPTGEVKHPRSGKVMQPTPLEGEPMDDPVDRRRALARWLTAPENRQFARNLANRFWAYFLGVGLVEPIDDMRATNPPTNPALLDALADHLIEHRFDVKQLMRAIMNSRTYQLSYRPTPENKGDRRFYTHYYVKRLAAEPLLDAIDFATGVQEKFPNIPLGTRAIELPDPNYKSYFLDTLGRPRRAIACECERTMQPNLAQALHIANGELVNRKIAHREGRVTKLLAAELTDKELISEIYLVTVSRYPTEEELQQCKEVVSDAPTRKEGVEDLFWALINSKEFLFVH